jgi:hypothetical protein
MGLFRLGRSTYGFVREMYAIGMQYVRDPAAWKFDGFRSEVND